MRNFPRLGHKTPSDIINTLDFIVKVRKDDVADFNNLKNVFISGRKVAKIPAGASDIVVTDTVGDFNYDTSYIYICVDNSGTAEWRRVAISSW